MQQSAPTAVEYDGKKYVSLGTVFLPTNAGPAPFLIAIADGTASFPAPIVLIPGQIQGKVMQPPPNKIIKPNGQPIPKDVLKGKN